MGSPRAQGAAAAPGGGGALGRLRNVLFGPPKNIRDPRVFHHVSLIAFLAWVGLGADGLSSSCYGPEEAFLALGQHQYLALFLAILTAVTVFVISTSYSQIIELFPSGGGGYLVASHLLGPHVGLVSGCALLVDYMLTITISIASGSDALFSFLPVEWQRMKLWTSTAAIVFLIVLNLRGVRESVLTLVPIFVAFVITHALMIAYSLIVNVGNLPQVVTATATETRRSVSELGLFATIVILLRAFSLGGGTFTGIEAVSNGLQILRAPRVETAKRTMRYMATSLAFTAAGLLVSFLLASVGREAGRTLNATLFYQLTDSWTIGNVHPGHLFVMFTLLSESALLFIAAQAGFLDGPRVLANMAIDFWVPTRFAHLSDRLVTQDGVLVMGASALAVLFFTEGDVAVLVVLYSINVFLTFSLSQLGMVIHWWQVRGEERRWLRKLAVNGLGLSFTALILAVTLVLKFGAGGWMTSVMTGATIALCLLVKSHYKNVHRAFRKLDDTLINVAFPPEVIPPTRACDPKVPTAVLMVGGFNGLGLHSLLSIHRCFPNYFKNIVLLEVGIIDSSRFKGRHEVRRLEKAVQDDLEEYEKFARNMGFYAESSYRLGTDAVAELEQLCLEAARRFPRVTFFAGKLILGRETFFERYLHNQTAGKIERRLQLVGLHTVVMPIRATI
jgi:amino acid transporter